MLPPLDKILPPPITNYTTYDTEMRKSMIDKLFFLDKVDATLFVDFGAADGILFQIMHDIFPGADYTYLGYDIDEKMNLDANNRDIPRAYFTSNWELIAEEVRNAQKRGIKTCVIANSLIHEVYHYGTEVSVQEFWDRLLQTGFDYIVIRDLCLAPQNLYDCFGPYDHEMVRVKADQKQLEDFENIWGPITEPKNLIHYLLKYRYTDNWPREVYENYFPYTVHEINAMLLNIPYETAFIDQFALQFNVRTVKRDFGIDIVEVKTHLKLILEKK
jgi:hypothetical protein